MVVVAVALAMVMLASGVANFMYIHGDYAGFGDNLCPFLHL